MSLPYTDVTLSCIVFERATENDQDPMLVLNMGMKRS